MATKKYLGADGISKLKALISAAFIGKNQGSENAGKVLGIGSDGIVLPVTGGGGGGGNTAIIAADWDEDVTYTVGTYAISSDKLWKCILQNSGEEPEEGTYWTEVTVGGELGTMRMYTESVSNSYNLHCDLAGSVLGKTLYLWGSPSSSMSTNTTYSIGTIQTPALLPSVEWGINVVGNSAGDLMFIRVKTNGDIELVPRVNVPTSGRALAVYLPYI